MKTAKHEMMRSVNTATLLQCIFENNGPITRQELQQRTGLSWGAVSNIVSDLLSMNILCEEPLKSKHAGRRPSVVDVNSRENLCIGVDIHMQGVACVAADLRGKTLVSRRRSIAGDDRQTVLDKAVEAVREVMEAAGVKRENYIGIGVAIQGSIDRSSRISVYSPHLPNWTDVPVCELLEKEFALPSLLVHDTIAMITAQRRSSGHQARNMAFVKLDMGLGLAMVLNGKLYVGSDGNASEFGHTIIDPQGPMCTCGNRGCLEAHVSAASILGRVKQGIAEGKTDIRLTGTDFEEDLSRVAQAARSGSAFEEGLFRQMGTYFGIGLSNLINFLNPELVVLGGEMVRYQDLYLETSMDMIRKNVWNNNRIDLQLSSLGSDGAAAGAAMYMLTQAFRGQIPHAIGDLFRTLYSEEDI